jgi:hypothetical protein
MLPSAGTYKRDVASAIGYPPCASSLVFAFIAMPMGEDAPFAEALSERAYRWWSRGQRALPPGAVVLHMPKSLNGRGGGMLEPALQCGIDPTTLGERSCL